MQNSESDAKARNHMDVSMEQYVSQVVIASQKQTIVGKTYVESSPNTKGRS